MSNAITTLEKRLELEAEVRRDDPKLRRAKRRSLYNRIHLANELLAGLDFFLANARSGFPGGAPPDPPGVARKMLKRLATATGTLLQAASTARRGDAIRRYRLALEEARRLEASLYGLMKSWAAAQQPSLLNINNAAPQ